MEKEIRLGISTCLLGQSVRYDGGHKLDRFLTKTLGQFVDYVPVCPEHECGLTIPREAMRLVGDPEQPRLVTIRTKIDHTDRMTNWAKKKLDELEKEDLCGFIFKSKSPSSGMARVKVYNEKGHPRPIGVGIWARMFMERFPLLPVEEEGRLHDPWLRENFIERVFLFKRWRSTCSERNTLGRLVEFHTHHKLQLLAHSPQIYRELGRLVAKGRDIPTKELYDEYFARLSHAMNLRSTVKKNTNVLHHMMGYFKKHLSVDEKRELLEVIGSYSAEQVPLVVPLTLLRHYVRKYEQPYLEKQTYLGPHPVELRLRNHV